MKNVYQLKVTIARKLVIDFQSLGIPEIHQEVERSLVTDAEFTKDWEKDKKKPRRLRDFHFTQWCHAMLRDHQSSQIKTQGNNIVGGTREGLSANISVKFQATLNLYAYFINHCLAVFCKFLGDFWAF